MQTLCGKQFGGSSKKIKPKIINIGSSNSTSGYIPKRMEISVSKRYLSTHVHSIVHDSQEMEATQVSFDDWMDKYNVVHPYYGISLS